MEEELLYLIALKKTEMVGDITAKKLINHFGSAKEIFTQPKKILQKIPGIGNKIIEKLQKSQWLQEAETELNFCSKNNIQVVSYIDKDYPYLLKKCPDSPIVFFQKGNINLKNKRILAIVGTRNATTYGTDFIKQFLYELAQLDVVIISGYAYGIDISAHKEAIKNGIQTVACLAHGLNIIYPKAHTEYCAAMIANGGFITDFGFLSPFDRKNFLSRNRIIAGLAEATIVIETSHRGGSLVTAGIANSYSRQVFALPGKYNDINSAGCNQLIHDSQAQLLISAQQLITDLNWESPKPQPIQQELFVSLTTEEENILKYLKNNGKQSMDNLSLGCQTPIYELSNLLFQLELKGAIRPLPGKIFESIN